MSPCTGSSCPFLGAPSSTSAEESSQPQKHTDSPAPCLSQADDVTDQRDNKSFIERKPSNIFDGSTPLGLLKAFTPLEVLLGLGVLLSAILCTVFPPKVLFALAAVLLLPPFFKALWAAPDPKAPLVRKGAVTGKFDGEFCVFLLGARSNKPWILNRQFAFVGKSFRKMMRELERLPGSSGYLGGEMFTSFNMLRGSHVLAVTYWRSYDHMIKFTYDQQLSHSGAVRQRDALFPEPVGMADCGIWHEAYRIKPGCHETVYLNCPPFHLGAATEVVPAVGPLRHSRGRLNASLSSAAEASQEKII